jgi:hypothetical protein
MYDYGVTDKEMEDYIHQHPNCFRHLRMLGIPVKGKGKPECTGNLEIRVDPRIVHEHKSRDINKPYQRAVLYNWTPNLQKF